MRENKIDEDYELNDNHMIELLKDAINLYEDREYTEAKENATEFVSRLTEYMENIEQ